MIADRVISRLSASLMVLVALLCTQPLMAQDSGKASIDAETKVISLDAEADLNYHYTIDISAAGFSSEPEAEVFFESLADKMVSFNVTAEENTVEVIINMRSQPDWGVAEWNEYLAMMVKSEE